MNQNAPVLKEGDTPQTYKQKLYAIWQAYGEKPQELVDHPEVPPHFSWVWDWFFDYPSPITWSEINAWADSAGFHVERWEGELLIRLDNLRK